MSAPAVVPPRAGEVIGDAPDRRVEILSDHDTLHATWSRFGPGREGADLHVHRRHTDLFYVLDGELTVRLGPEGEPAAAPAGTLVRVPPLVVHGFRNASEGEVRYLNLHAPGSGFAGYMRAMRDGRRLTYDQEPPPPGGGRPPSEAAIGGGERLGDGVTLLADVEEITVYEVEDTGAPFPAPGQLRSLYVLEGELTLTLDGDEVLAGGGTWLTLPAGAEPAGTARLLDIRTPGGAG